MRSLLVHPPFADPTQPYVSLPTLAGHLRSRGLEVDLLDLNVEGACFLLSPEGLARLADRIEERWLELNEAESLGFEEQRRYLRLADAWPRVRLAAAAETGIVETFLSRELFFDLPAYERARQHADAALEGVSALHHPFRYSFNHAAHSVVPWSFDLLEEHAAIEGPLDELYARVFEEGAETGLGDDGFPRFPPEELGFVGFSVAFPSQLPEAWRIARHLRRLAPEAFLALGGPAIHQVVVHLDDPQRERLLELVDGIGLFEGEETLAQLLPLLPAWRKSRDPALLHEVPNLLVRGDDGAPPRLGPRHVLDLREAATPDPEGLDLDRYLAPERTLLYAPTRGCYWNQCSFCYYGLSETATASYREIPPQRAAEEMEALSRQHDVRDFYVSCDVLSPAYAVRLAQALVDRGLTLRWSSDLKIEKYFTKERCELLARSGLTAAAFGIESGSDRILSLMRKGCDRETMTRVSRAFRQAGIATEWMTFTDHPGERTDEALATVSWVEEEQEGVGLFIVGEFGLERGSAIFQDPKAFGVDEVWFAEGDELRLYALYRESGAGRSEADRERVDRAVGRVSRRWRLAPYPWAGANSTHHSLLWFSERGPDAFHEDVETPHRIESELADAAEELGLPAEPRFSFEAIEHAEEGFFAAYLGKALYTTLPQRRGGPGFALAPLSHPHYLEASARVAGLGRAD